ncbi:MAG TPA: alkaline phosphatase family protein [Ktedonobacteraceae bacterium]|nr:alkaline phosphatase family protein [Ktedonobacteraceae bacterium]
MYRKQPHSLWQLLHIRTLVHTGIAFGILLAFVCIGPGAASRLTAAASQKAIPLQHIVFMVKENHTFDNYFGTFPGADGATTYTDHKGVVHPLNHQPDRLFQDILHDHAAFLTGYDHGRLDNFSKIPGAIQNINGVLTDEADSQFYQSDIPNYWSYAQTFTLTDHTFTTIRSDSFPNHLYTIAAADDDAANIPVIFKLKHRWGCDAPQAAYVKEIHSDGTHTRAFPCFNDFQTLGDLLSAQKISWKFYSPGKDQSGYEYNSYNAVEHIRLSKAWNEHIVDYTQFATDVANGTLPTVSWLIEPVQVSDHPTFSVCAGENWTVSQINTIMNNKPLWNTTAIFLTWDDFGGFYDHVVPPVGPNKYLEYGLRTALIVISPYAKPHFVDSTVYNFTSLLSFAEHWLNLPSLGGLDQYANDMSSAFDFNQQPLPPLILQQRTCPPSPSSLTPSQAALLGGAD